MPLGEGWWLNANTGEEVEVFEHAREVLNHPEVFGLAPEDVVGAGSAVDAADANLRRELLTRVMKNGWIRVRSFRGRNVFETAHLNDDALYQILQFAQRHNVWDNEYLAIHDVTQPEGHNDYSMSMAQLQAQFGVTEKLAATRIGRVKIFEVILLQPVGDDEARAVKGCITQLLNSARSAGLVWSKRVFPEATLIKIFNQLVEGGQPLSDASTWRVPQPECMTTQVHKSFDEVARAIFHWLEEDLSHFGRRLASCLIRGK